MTSGPIRQVMMTMNNDFIQDYLMHHGVTGQKWGVRLGPPYPLNAEALATKMYSVAKKIEPQITSDVTTAIKQCGAEPYGLENRLKTKESTARKIETDAKEKQLPRSKAAESIRDSIRYTAISKDEQFTNNYFTIKNALQSKGYSEVRCKNYFDLYNRGEVKHKAVQSVFKTPDGYFFELQFHTPSSQDAKNKKIPIYEERRKPGLTRARKEELEKQMDDLAKQVSEPKDIYRIKSH